jgi:hypothetical protein
MARYAVLLADAEEGPKVLLWLKEILVGLVNLISKHF